MRHLSRDITTATPRPPLHEPEFDAAVARVERAYRRMRALDDRGHAPAEARAAAAELAAALRQGRTAVAVQLRRSQPPTPWPRGRWRHRHAGRAAAPAEARWSRELVRLSQIAVWLRRTTLDDLGVHLPAAHQVGDYAATAPHIAGLGFGSGDLDVPDRRIGVDLPAAVDGVDRELLPAVAAASVPAGAA